MLIPNREGVTIPVEKVTRQNIFFVFRKGKKRLTGDSRKRKDKLEETKSKVLVKEKNESEFGNFVISSIILI